ncbi:MAG: GNAT family N-acetyltransferase [Clostridia bacterium]|nr:GNAT family N-acetyltransferase [Clostridia bacterium]
MTEKWYYGLEGHALAKPLRDEVFVGEQNFPAHLEDDEHEAFARHFIVEDNGETVATGRLIKLEENVYKLGRIAVKQTLRGTGLGSRVTQSLINKAKELGATTVKISGQTHAVPFYEKFGFAVAGPEFYEENLPHVDMEMSLVFDGCDWVGFEKDSVAVYARKSFNVENAKDVKILSSGLGFCHIKINGIPVTDEILSPAWTNYEKRDLTKINMPVYDTLVHRIHYVENDISALVKNGENTVEFHIGAGWYGQNQSRNEGMAEYGQLKLCYKILADGETVSKSDEDVEWKPSYVTRTNIFFGETHDARLINKGEWRKVTKLDNPLSILTKQTCLPDREIRTIIPKKIYSFGDTAIYDLGEHVAGYPKIVFGERAITDERAFVRYAEELNEDGSLNFYVTERPFRMQRDEFVFSQEHKDHSYYPLFTWHAGRYFEVQGNAYPTEFAVVHTDMKQICHYHSDDEILQWLFDTYIRTQLSNVHCCVPSDCPHRERLGYTGDGQLACDAAMTCFDAKNMYLKWMQDIADSQDIYGGHVEHTAPFYGGGGGPGGWGGAIVFVPYTFYKHYGDKEVLKKYYRNMCKYLEYMENHSEESLVVRSEKGGWCLGDWCTPEKMELPEPFVNTYFYIRAMRCVREIAAIIGENVPVDMDEREERAIRSVYNKYFDNATGSFCNAVQGADAFAVDLGLGDERTYKNVLAKYSALGKFDTGIFGTDILVRILCERGDKDLARKLLTSRDGIGTFNYMREHGATTLWENWDGADSHSHPMFGAVIASMVKFNIV